MYDRPGIVLFAVSNKVILAAVVGSLSCALLLVIALGITYRLVCLQSSHRSSRHVSPIMAIEERIYAERSAPPPYPEAMATLRPYDEYQRDVVNQSERVRPAEESGGGGETTDTAPLVRIPTDTSDDDLIDVSISETPLDLVDGDEGIVITLGCLARWHRFPKPSADSSESSVNAVEGSPASAATTVCDSAPEVDVTDTSSPTCDQPDPETTNVDHADDDRPLLIC